MWVGAIEFDLLLGDVHSLKEKRSLVRPLIAEVKRKYGVSVAEVDHQDLHRRAGIGVAVVAAVMTCLVAWAPFAGLGLGTWWSRAVCLAGVAAICAIVGILGRQNRIAPDLADEGAGPELGG